MSADQLGPYRIERRIGRGGMGSVYEGVHVETGQRAAVKVLSASLAEEANFRDRFAIEIETLKTLRHPNIVHLYGFGEHDGHMFYSMELIHGQSLHEELRGGRRFTWREVVKYAIEICAALKHAHDHGVIHRDLKPANLMLTSDDHIKLTDFGIARLFGATQLTVAGGVIGTADYMAPEQAEGKPPTVRTDLYSLGSVMFALLAHRPPFLKNSLPEMLHSLRFESPPPLRSLAPETPAELAELVSQLLEKDPEERVATSLVLSNRLKAMEHALSVRPQTRENPPPQKKPAGGSDVTIPGDAHAQRTRPSDSRVGGGPTVVDRKSPAPLPADDATVVSLSSDLDEEEIRLQRIEDDPPTVRHFTSVDDEKRKQSARRRQRDEDSLPLWLIALLATVAVAVVAGAAWLLTRPPSADALYGRVAAAAEKDSLEQLAESESDIKKFLDYYPDDARRAEMDGYLEAIEFYRRQRLFERRAMQEGGVEKLSPVELMYVESIEDSRINPERAAAKLQALIDLYGNQADAPPEVAQCVATARDHLARLQAKIDERRREHLKLIEQRLAWADENREADAPAAQAVWRGVIELYRDKPWAAEIVERCQAELSESADKANGE